APSLICSRDGSALTYQFFGDGKRAACDMSSSFSGALGGPAHRPLRDGAEGAALTRCGSELELDRQLDLPLRGPTQRAGRVGQHLRDGAEVRVAVRGGGIGEGRVIEDVEGLHADLVLDVAEPGDLDQVHVDVEVAGSAGDVATGAAERRGLLRH